MKKLLFFGIALIFSISACKKESEDSTNNIITSNTDCKDFSGLLKNSTSSDESCILYEYDEDSKVLSIEHINSGFNCCPGELTATYDIEEQQIIIRESEARAGCNCLCLFDLDMQIENLQPGIYLFRAIEPYLGSNPPFEFELDLTKSTTGNYCIERTEYPWNLSL